MRIRTSLATLTLTVVTSFSAAGPATAAHGGGHVLATHGGCSGPALWRLKAKPENGRIQLEAEVDSNHTGQRWVWRIRHNGSVSSRGRATTAGPSGSFTVERRMKDLAGTDHFRFRAVRRATGEVCRGTIAL